MTVATLSREDRVMLARAALARAEQRTGARSVLPLGGPDADPGRPGVASARPRAGRPGAGPRAGSRAGPRRAAAHRDHHQRAPADGGPAAAGPDPARRAAPRRHHGGHGVDVAGAGACSRTRAPAGRGRPSSASRPSACSPPPRRGSSLDRLAVVPRPGREAPTVVAALLDGVDVVVVGPEAALTDADRRTLSARARDRGSVLLSTVAWPGAGVVLTVESGPVDGDRRRRGAPAHARAAAGAHRPGQRRRAALARPAPCRSAPTARARRSSADEAPRGPGLRLVG